jgi:hypothetical protein
MPDIAAIPVQGALTSSLPVAADTGRLVRVPLRRNQYKANTTGTCTVAYQEEGLATNNDNYYSGIDVQVTKPAAGTAAGCEVVFFFYGRRLGLRWATAFKADGQSGLQDFVVIVDGVPYPLSYEYTYQDLNSLDTFPSGELCGLVAEDLGEGLHEAHVYFVPVASGVGSGTTSEWFLYGYLCEDRAGYQDRGPQRSLYPCGGGGSNPNQPQAVPTSATNLPNNPANVSGYELRTFRKVLYCNTAGSTTTVAIYKGNVQVKEIVLGALGSTTAPLSSGEFDPGDYTVFDASQSQTSATSWSHKASQAGANFLLLGAH